jgi:hypothetical protein
MSREEIIDDIEGQELQRGIEQIMENSPCFSFLKDEEDLYTLEDLKEIYS